jgi:hypothetical protein
MRNVPVAAIPAQSLTALALLALLPLAACGSDGAPKPAAAAPDVGLPEGLVVRGPAQGTHVAAAKASARQGDEVVVVGRIGGSESPFVAGRAVFTIVDPALVACSDMDDPDHCRTPWDYCCEDRARMRAGTATVEVAGADGRPLAVALQGTAGLEPLATVAVTGTVVERNDAGLFVVRARRIEVR